MEASQREMRARLSACLAKLNRLNPADLVREDVLGHGLSFRVGLPYFTRTLELFRRITPRDCAHAPAEILKIVVDDAENALHRFEEILSFDPQGLANPGVVRNTLIDEVRDAHHAAYENVALIIRPLRGQPERIRRQWSGGMALAVIIIAMLAVAIAAHHYLLFDLGLGDLREAIHKIAAGR